MAKKTQTELLQEIVDLLTPVSNLNRYHISQINAEIKRQEELAPIKATKTAEGEMKKLEEKEK